MYARNVCYIFHLLGSERACIADSGLGKLETESRDALTTLREWVETNFVVTPTALEKSTLVFGPGGSYYVRSPKGCIWNNLPPDLERAIHDTISTKGAPRLVGLGRDETWFALWDDDSHASNLKTHYDDLQKLLARDLRVEGDIRSVVLNTEDDQFFATLGSGGIHWRLFLQEDTMIQFRGMCCEYVERKQGKGRSLCPLTLRW